MGQYYRAFLRDKEENVIKWSIGHRFNMGAKLMETSYVGNEFVETMASFLRNHPQHVVWCGDYADEEIRGFNLYQLPEYTFEMVLPNGKNPYNPVWCWLVNHDKHLAANIESNVEDEDGFKIHILPLLTVNGNGRGSGDYHGTNMDDVGAWAGDLLSIEKEKPEWCEELEIIFEETY